MSLAWEEPRVGQAGCEFLGREGWGIQPPGPTLWLLL